MAANNRIKGETIGARFPLPMASEIKNMASENQRSNSNQIVRLCEIGLEKTKKKKK